MLYFLRAIINNDAQLLECEINSKRGMDDKGKKNIVIFAGFAHIYRIMPTLRGYFKYMKSFIDKEELFSQSRLFIDDVYGRKCSQEFIDKYGVNSTDFFALEKE